MYAYDDALSPIIAPDAMLVSLRWIRFVGRNQSELGEGGVA